MSASQKIIFDVLDEISVGTGIVSAVSESRTAMWATSEGFCIGRCNGLVAFGESPTYTTDFKISSEKGYIGSTEIALVGHTHDEYLTDDSLSGYATEDWVKGRGYATASSIPSSISDLDLTIPDGYTLVIGNANIYYDCDALLIEDAGMLNVSAVALYDRVNIYNGKICFGSDNSMGWNDVNSLDTAGDVYIGFTDENYTGDGSVDLVINNANGGITLNSDYNIYISATQVSINDGDLYVYGTAYAYDHDYVSDITLKNIIEPIDIEIEDIANAPCFNFQWIGRNDDRMHVGTAAQYWEPIVPSAVGTHNNTLTLSYAELALASVISVAKTTVLHEQRIAELEKENESLRQKIEELKSA
jgi:hypothetical protein